MDRGKAICVALSYAADLIKVFYFYHEQKAKACNSHIQKLFKNNKDVNFGRENQRMKLKNKKTHQEIKVE